ncbi:MAG: MFS transporter [Capsulimonadaceae bacterium]
MPDETSEPPLSTWPVALRALRHRNFQLFMMGQGISLIGTWMQNIGQAWLALQLSGSALTLGLLTFCGQLPIFLLAPLGGYFADRRNRRLIVIATQTTSMLLAFILAVDTFTGNVRIWHLFVLSILLGVVNAFDIPAWQSFYIEMVGGKDDLTNAIALNSSMINGARIVGPAVAGYLIHAVGEAWCFMINALSYIAVILGLLMMRLPTRAIEPRTGSAAQHVAKGFEYAMRTGPIRALLLLLCLVSLAGMPYIVVMPIFAKAVLHGNSKTLGLLLGAGGFGAMCGALTLASRRGVRFLGKWNACAAAGFGAFLILVSMSRGFWISMVLLVPMSFCAMIVLAATNTLVQSMVPDKLRGRVMAVHSMMFMGMQPFGGLLAGAVCHVAGAPFTLAAGGTVCITGAAIFALGLPKFQAAATILMSRQEHPSTSTGLDMSEDVAAGEAA